MTALNLDGLSAEQVIERFALLPLDGEGGYFSLVQRDEHGNAGDSIIHGSIPLSFMRAGFGIIPRLRAVRFGRCGHAAFAHRGRTPRRPVERGPQQALHRRTGRQPARLAGRPQT